MEETRVEQPLPSRRAQIEMRLIELRREEEIARARKGILAFTLFTKPDYQVNWHHRLTCKYLNKWLRGEITRLMIFEPPGHGKALALDTPIPTPNGWARMGDLRAGDQVFGLSGKPCNVVAVSQVWKDRKVYRVSSDADPIGVIADGAHEWSARTCRKRQSYRHWDTEELAARTSDRKALLPRAGALDLPAAKLPIDPYVLGVWLGDGGTHHATITKNVADALFIQHEFSRRGYVTSDRATAGTFGVIGLQAQLRAAGVLKNKYIPPEYLRGSKEQRLALLQGLIDTGGHVAPKGQIEFCSMLSHLAAGVRELVFSLGYKASLCTGRAVLNGVDHGEKYRVMFYMPDAALLPRKRPRLIEPSHSPGQYLTVEEAGRADTVCIEVDAPDHLFLCGKSFMPTHNSELTSRRVPAMLHGLYPDDEIMAASYSASLADDMTADVQRIMDSPEYQALFPGTRIPAPGTKHPVYKRNSAEHHVVGRAGKYRGQGVGGAFTGKRARWVVIDDPLKGREAADSPVFRNRLYSFYANDLRSRLKRGGGSILLTQTRWHEDDLAGRLLALQKADPNSDQWVVLVLPAFKENDLNPDDPRELDGVLWPGAYSLKELLAIKANDPRGFSALYQQRPVAQEGNIFRREWWKYYRQLPSRFDMVIQSWDFAIKDKDGADFTVGLVMGKLGADKYVLDVVRGRMSFPVACQAVVSLSGKWPAAHKKLIEDKANGPAVIDALKKRISGLIAVEPSGDKVSRAHGVSADVEAGNVYLPDPSLAPWVHDFTSELADFPNATFDDQVDAFTQALHEIRKHGPVYAPIAGHGTGHVY